MFKSMTEEHVEGTIMAWVENENRGVVIFMHAQVMTAA